MSRKRRVFDIDVPDELGVTDDALADVAPSRRGPMASAIAENAEALQARKTRAEAIRAENDALAHEYVALKDSGAVVLGIPLDKVETRLLVRDRIDSVDDPELEELVTSIRDIGLSNPIRVVPGVDGAYELVQGFRRLKAYRQLDDAAPGAGWDRIPALVVGGEAGQGGLYRRMVDENIVRKDLSFAEMAHVAKVYAADPNTEAADLSAAIAELFQSAPYSKRSYIKSFAYLLDEVGDALTWPHEIPRALGVGLARVLRDKPEAARALRGDLSALTNRTAETELDVLRRHGDAESTGSAAEAPTRRRRAGGRTKTTFHIDSSAGQVKCTAAMGRLEIRVDRDFSAIERKRLEEAIATLVDGLA